MGFPNVLHISDPTDGILYKVENGATIGTLKTNMDVYGVLVSQNQADIYTVNRANNSITRINAGSFVGDILVGNMPYGICEDPNGMIYVTNYADNTVSIIKDNVADKYPLSVDKGPRGIVSDAQGTIWVACYLSSTVLKIVNKTVVDRIKVPENPEAITCDCNNNIWVTCASANKLVKISKSAKALTLDTGRKPVAVVVDTNLNVFVTNFEDDTVTMYSSSDNMAETIIPVGDGPNAIDIDEKNNVYVTSNLSGENVYQIAPSSKKVVNTFHVCESQAAFGDFTGCAAFNVLNPSKNASSGVSENVEAFVDSIKPTYRITDIVEGGNGETTFTVTSDMVDLTEFEVLTLNGIENIEGTLSFTLPAASIGSTLQLDGNYHADGNSWIHFIPQKYKDVFGVKFGIVNEELTSYQEIKSMTVDFTYNSIEASVDVASIDGYIVVLIPKRIYMAAKDYMTTGSGFNYGNAWLPADGDPIAEAILELLPEGYEDVYQLLYDPEVSLAGDISFFHFYEMV